MSETMVEKVAKAIAEVVDRRTSGDYDIEGEIAEECSRAAIEAMRNPNHAMEDAGWAHMGTAPFSVFSAMIAKALATLPGEE